MLDYRSRLSAQAHSHLRLSALSSSTSLYRLKLNQSLIHFNRISNIQTFLELQTYIIYIHDLHTRAIVQDRGENAARVARVVRTSRAGADIAGVAGECRVGPVGPDRSGQVGVGQSGRNCSWTGCYFRKWYSSYDNSNIRE